MDGKNTEEFMNEEKAREERVEEVIIVRQAIAIIGKKEVRKGLKRVKK